MNRQFNLLATSELLTILQDVQSKARITLPSYAAAQYKSQVIPIFNMDCFEM